MNYIKRNIDAKLIEWKDSEQHKPLLLRGARQVGKSSSIRHLGSKFKTFVEINFERNPELKELFKGALDPRYITSQLALITNKTITPGETLLFFDEIQECPSAITSLRYYWEEMPSLHVIAAGSLLEFTLNEISSFGIGRIRSMFMYPLSFDEFLLAQSGEALSQAIAEASPTRPLNPIVHNQIVDIFRSFILIGGMPEAVSQWCATKDYLTCRKIHTDIVDAYEIDFAKYREKVNPSLLRMTLRSVIRQIGSKFTYSRVGEYRTETVREALMLLSLAGLITPVKATSANGLPLAAEHRAGFTKYLYLDSGLLLAILQNEGQNIGQITTDLLTNSASEIVNKGSLTEMIAGLEIIKNSSSSLPPELNYWLKEKKGSNAEVDYIIANNGKIIPIEVKAGVKGGMKSLNIFMESKNISTGIRMSLEEFGVIQLTNPSYKIDIFPLYAVKNLFK